MQCKSRRFYLYVELIVRVVIRKRTRECFVYVELIVRVVIREL